MPVCGCTEQKWNSTAIVWAHLGFVAAVVVTTMGVCRQSHRMHSLPEPICLLHEESSACASFLSATFPVSPALVPFLRPSMNSVLPPLVVHIHMRITCSHPVQVTLRLLHRFHLYFQCNYRWRSSASPPPHIPPQPASRPTSLPTRAPIPNQPPPSLLA